jgi:hypothetical protein
MDPLHLRLIEAEAREPLRFSSVGSCFVHSPVIDDMYFLSVTQHKYFVFLKKNVEVEMSRILLKT